MVDAAHARDDAGLRRLASRLEAFEGSAIALDTEFLTERSYYPRLCLVQVGIPGLLATIDPLGCEDLAPLGEFLSRGPCLVVHAGSQDLAILMRRFGVGAVPPKVFDTQIAAAFLGHGHSIAYARLVEALCGARLKRSRAYTDWSRRPLEPEQLDYALDDVRFLLEMHENLRSSLDDRGRLEWAEEEFQRMRETAIEEPDPWSQWRRISGLRGSDGRALAVLRELAAWREREAQRLDLPRPRVVNDRVLLEIARRKPKTAADLRGMRGLHPRQSARSAEAMVEAVRRGLECPAQELRALRPRSRSEEEPKVAAAAALASVFLQQRAGELELSAQLLANRKELEELVRVVVDDRGTTSGATEDTGARRIPLLEGWRRSVAGDDLLRLLRGDYALRVVAGGGELRLLVENPGGSSPDLAAAHDDEDKKGETGIPR